MTIRNRFFSWSVIILFFFFQACAPGVNRSLSKIIQQAERDFNDHIGLSVYDPVAKEPIYSFQDDRYFTPASNTKVLTLFASLKILGDSIPGLKYAVRNDSLLFWGTGDPSLFNKNCFSNSRVYDLLQGAEQALYYAGPALSTPRFGPGWAWDDYNDYYSPERSALPVYGNVFTITGTRDSLSFVPEYFRGVTSIRSAQKLRITRKEESNQTVIEVPNKFRRIEKDVPFRTDSLLVSRLLTDTLKRPVNVLAFREARGSTLYSIPADSLYKVMMQDSDNFIAEQLLILCAGVLRDTLDPKIAIREVTQRYLADLKDDIRWVDGSGLSRYNLLTPRSMVQVWEKILEQTPREKLFPLLATGGKSGTIKDWFKADTPYLFGKTGTLSNNHCLSGFLITKKGRTLVFSLMNSNFTRPVKEVRQSMEEILLTLHQKL